MNSAKAPKLPAELAMPARLEGLLSLLVASPMTLLGCTPDEPPADTEGSSSGTASGGTSSTGAVDSSSTGGGTSTGDGTTSTGSSSSSGSSGSGTTDVSTSSTGPSESSSSSEGGEESSTTDGGQGNTCERVGDLMNMCFGGGYGYYYESSCNYYINYFISIGDLACAQAYNEVYSCIADLECAEVFMGVYDACEVQYDNMYNVCWDWGGTTTFGWETESGGWDSGWWGTDSGWWGSEDSGFPGDSGVVFIVPPSESDGWSTGGGGWGTSGGT